MKIARRFWLVAGVVILLALALPSLAQAQEEFRLNFSRNFGYSAGNEVRGTFTASVIGDANAIKRVVFMIDGAPLATVEQSPWQYKFKTTDHPFGMHTLSAVVTTTDERTVTTNERSYNFVDSEAESQGTVRIIGPVLALVLGITVIGLGTQWLMGRGKPVSAPAAGTRRNYGFAGGAICRHCNRPTPRHVWGINLVAGKLDRCENCGKWSMMVRAPDSVLWAAEQAELADAKAGSKPVTEKSDEERLKEMLDSSKYTDTH